jgi:serine/threonine protein kinase
MPFEPGQKVGDYEIVAMLGAGGLGAVYEVEHLISRRHEAMKVLLPEAGTPDMVERFRREVQTLATLNHVNIAALHTAFYSENQLIMIMELIQGETLRDRHVREPIPLPQALDFIAQTLQALVYAHRLGVVHRDIKPSNIMITPAGIVKLLDFGIALTGQASGLTRAGYLLGSLHYMSPEQVNGNKATPCSDIYSVGVTLYELLTGRLPINGATTYQIMLAHMNQAPTPPHEIAPQIPLPLSAAILRALEKEPERRFASAEEFLLAIQPGHAHREMATASTVPFTTPVAASPPPTPSGQQKLSPSGEQKPPSTGGQNTAAMAQTKPYITGEQKPSSGSGFQSLPLEELARKLAVYIGPVAKFVVKKLAAQHTDLDTIYREAAKQIPSDADRTAFLRSKKT